MPEWDTDLCLLTSISQSLEGEYRARADEWEGSPFAWLRRIPSRQRGAVGERLVAEWLTRRGFKVARSGDPEADRIVEGSRVEIKFSTLWQNGSYAFQQIRDQRYDIIVCLGVAPSDAHCWVMPKADVMRLWREESVIHTQHGGAGGIDTAWFRVKPTAVPEWLVPFGGTLSEAFHVLARRCGGDPLPPPLSRPNAEE